MRHLLRIVLFCEVMALTANASAQTIADLARQERGRKKAVASKTYTNADVGESAASRGLPAVTTAGTGAAATAGAPPATPVTTSVPADSKGRDEKYWRDQFTAARANLKRAEDQVRVLEARVSTSNTQMLQQSDLYNRESRLQAEVNAATAEIATARQEAEKARLQIGALEEDLRRSGGPAGWAR